MPELHLTLKIPFECEPPVRVAPALEFYRWLPSGDSSAIFVQEDNLSISLWFDEKCVGMAFTQMASDFVKYPRLCAHFINVNVSVTGISDLLAKYMQQPGENEERERSPHQSEYEALGWRILSAVISRINRLISFARATKGQYWLTEFKPDWGMMPSIYCGFNAVAQIDGGKPFRFEPAYMHQMSFELHDGATSITEQEWIQVNAFVNGSARAPLVGELLARAEYLIEAGHARGAITEAYTALEMSVSTFARNVSNMDAFSNPAVQKLGKKSLAKQIEHLGFSSSVLYLLPLVFSEEILSLDVVDNCSKAIELRNNIVHNGMRNVDAKVAVKAVKAFRKYCSILQLQYAESHEDNSL